MSIRLLSRSVTVKAGTVVVALLVTATAIVLLPLRGDSESLAAAMPSSALVAHALVLGAAVFVYFHWRMVDGGAARRLAGWLTTGLIATGVHGLMLAAPVDAGATAAPGQWPLVSQLLVVALLIGFAVVCEHLDVPGDPALVGALAGLVLSGVFLVVGIAAGPLALPSIVENVLVTIVMLGGLALASMVRHRTTGSLWARRHLALAAVALTTAHCLDQLQKTSLTLAVIVVAANLLGAVSLCLLANRLLEKSIEDERRELMSVHAALQEARAEEQVDRNLLHEVGSMVAGIASASRLMHQDSTLTPERRQRLEEMLEAELSRLERLMSDRAPKTSREIDVDHVVQQLVVSHQARGLEVCWSPSHLRAVGDADDLAEVVNILLENATRHGRGRPVTLQARAEGGVVELICSDSGPGVAPEVAGRLFESGARGPDSGGQGLGLAIAHSLMTDRGGSLEHVETSFPGATFVARLPQVVMADDTLNLAAV